MISITCDVCKKKLDNPVNNERDLFYYSNFSVCEGCKDNLESVMKTQIRGKEPFSYEWYGKLVQDSFGKACQKGKS